ncbi:MAG TPA: TAXI family TRAP transporter solute-binding subunit [Nostocaceae cyanobacterium]|nr:TAXI family TRAP transporter solute-binding subunit [Nostocaceae cyanobacterium]
MANSEAPNNFWNRYKWITKPRYLFRLLLIVGLIIFLIIHTILDLNQVHRLVIAAGSKTGESYILSQAIAQVVARHEPKIKIEVLETKGTEESLNLLEAGKVQLAAAQADIPTPSSARLICNLFADAFQLVVTAKSGIYEVAALKGKRLALPSKGGGQYNSFWELARHYRLTEQDMIVQDLPETEANNLFLNGQVDAVFRVRPPGNRAIQELIQKSNGRIVGIDQGAAMKISQPAFEPAFIPKGAYLGNPPIPNINLPTITVQRTLLASRNVEAGLIRKITVILFDYRQELAKIMPLAANISPPSQVSGTGLPLHPGAAAFYDRDKPNFFQENADYIALIMSVVLLIGSWLWQLKERFEKAQKNRGDDYNQDIVKIMKEISVCADLDNLEKIRTELIERFEKVVESLDQDRITAETFQSFTFTWEAAMSELRDRQVWITRKNLARQQIKPS